VSAEGTDGTGKIDCNGGEPNLNIRAKQDHETQSPPGSNGGLPQDPECDDTRPVPDGTTSTACLESASTTCSPNHLHPGACNSPIEFVETGTFASGDMRVIEYLALRLVTDVGPDGEQCTDDDVASAPATLRAFFTTGTARSTIYDSNHIDNQILDHLTSPGCTNCITEVTGLLRSCNNINGSSGVRNLKLVGALPVIDIDASSGDAAVTVEIECQ
jgi:hypothetical protein